MLNRASKTPSYKIAVVLAALSFCMNSFDAMLGELFHFEYSSLHTAASMYLPLLLSLCMLLAVNRKVGTGLVEIKGLVVLCFIGGFWLINYCCETISGSDVCLSDYDQKRLWFFIHGVLLSGLLGVCAARHAERFSRLFLPYFCVLTVMSSSLYLLTYRPGEEFERLLGERALGAGILAAFGVASCLSLFFLDISGSRRLSPGVVPALIAAILVNVAAVVLSATRGAALCCLVSVAIFAWMVRRSRRLLVVVGLVIALSYCGFSLGKTYVPQAVVDRLLMKEHGFDLRRELTDTILGMIRENPFGRVRGYESTRLSMDYSHNTLLQYVAEGGLQSVPILIVLFGVVLWNLTSGRADSHVRVLVLFGVPVFVESFSAGSAYNSLLWFLLFFVFSLGEGHQYDAAFQCDESRMYANGPSFAEN